MTHVSNPAMRAGLLQREVAEQLGVTVRTLNTWLREGYGPQPVRDGNRLIYDPADVATFIAGAVA
ncbi:MAG: MerR family transcriptional regulator [Sphingomicrobium sp.]